LLLAIPTFFLATMLVFMMLRLVPGDVLFTLLGETLVGMPQDQIEQVKKEFGFDKPIYEQYAVFMGSALRGDLGKSLRDRRPVFDKIMERLPVTLEISLISLILSISIAIPIGVISAIRQDTFLDYLLRGFAVGGLSIPGFWLGTLAVVLPAMWWGIIPPLVYTDFTRDPIQNLKQVWLPSLIQGILLSATVMRMTRTMMLEVLRQDYIRTAWSKGLRERAVIFRHALKNAMIPVITVIGLQIGFLLGGTVITEQIFSLPGMGRLLVEALTFRDYPVIQGINFIVASWVIMINLCVDLSYGYLDPRIRFR